MSRHSQKENEVRRIAGVSPDGRTLTLSEPLSYTHLGVAVPLPDGTLFQARAEVGLLTRNILVRGSTNSEWSDQVKACPSGFNTGTLYVLHKAAVYTLRERLVRGLMAGRGWLRRGGWLTYLLPVWVVGGGATVLC